MNFAIRLVYKNLHVLNRTVHLKTFQKLAPEACQRQIAVQHLQVLLEFIGEQALS